MSDRFDVVVIGGGSAGLVGSGLLAALGARVALVEKEALGGECLYTGCVPSKALLAAAATWHERRWRGRYGLPPAANGVEVDLGAVMDAVRRAVDAVYGGPETLRAAGVAEVVFGPPRFVDGGTLDVAGRRIRGRRFLLCTGARPRIPGIPGIDRVPYLTSRNVYDLKTLPPRLAVIGGGQVGCEMAQAFRRLGSRVTLIGRAGSLLPRDDPELTTLLRERFVEEGVEVLLSTEAVGVQPIPGGGAAIRLRGAAERVEVDRVLVAAGRRPNIEGLDLGRAGVETEPGGIVVDDRFRTSAPNIWALGDVTGLTPFSHMAEAQARAVAPHIALGLPVAFDQNDSVWTTFTDPELARMGPDEERAREHHRRIRVHRLDLREIDRAQSEKRFTGRAKVLTAGLRGRVIAAHLLAPHAGELIQEWILARKHGLRLDQISNAVHVYPSWAMLNQRTADGAFRAWSETPGWRRWSRRLYRAARVLRWIRGER